MKSKKTKEMHGMSKTPLYRVWADMKNRCYNENIIGYELYGKRGITVCDEWFESFVKFYEDMGSRPSRKHQLDRIDVNGNYCKENCRWALPAINGANKSKKASGVQLNRTGKKYVARINADGKSYNIGSFKTFEEANNAYLEMRFEWYGLR